MSKVGEAPSETHSTSVLMNPTFWKLTFPEGPCPARNPSHAHTDGSAAHRKQLVWTAPSLCSQSMPEAKYTHSEVTPHRYSDTEPALPKPDTRLWSQAHYLAFLYFSLLAKIGTVAVSTSKNYRTVHTHVTEGSAFVTSPPPHNPPPHTHTPSQGHPQGD